MATNNLAVHADKLPVHDAKSIAIDIATVVCLAILAHLLVRLIRFISDWLIRKSDAKKNPVGFVTRKPAFITLTGLISSALTLVIYSVGVGFILYYLGVPTDKFVKTYLATASVIGFAVGFGSQGLVQDVITGLTLIFTDTLEVGDMVEISGYSGRVESVGLRFTEVRNFQNQRVFLANRNIANIARFPRGGITAYVDAEIPPNADRGKFEDALTRTSRGMWLQFGAIILSEPEILESPKGSQFLRVEFRIWPGQGALIESTFRQRLLTALKTIDPGYADWMIVVTYRSTGLATKSTVSI
ncbi:MAG TPA: mechanosensitive ion channel domain-containing protein [Candidatus Polarisedimenticolia bacterium]|nr:mechanosensitive ion channel domain-containing protein [Candidatus Polarisedimenticolia bacterium]